MNKTLLLIVPALLIGTASLSRAADLPMTTLKVADGRNPEKVAHVPEVAKNDAQLTTFCSCMVDCCHHSGGKFKHCLQWLCFRPVKCKGCCAKQCPPCCTPPLYMFFLCEGCGRPGYSPSCSCCGH